MKVAFEKPFFVIRTLRQEYPITAERCYGLEQIAPICWLSLQASISMLTEKPADFLPIKHCGRVVEVVSLKRILWMCRVFLFLSPNRAARLVHKNGFMKLVDRLFFHQTRVLLAFWRTRELYWAEPTSISLFLYYFAEGAAEPVEVFPVLHRHEGTDGELLPSEPCFQKFSFPGYQKTISVILSMNQRWRAITMMFHRLRHLLWIHLLFSSTSISTWSAKWTKISQT